MNPLWPTIQSTLDDLYIPNRRKHAQPADHDFEGDKACYSLDDPALLAAPKLYFLDAGLQSTLTRQTPELALTQRTRFDTTLETWVYGELLKLLSITPESWFMSHFKDKDQVEVDFVLESPLREVIGIEVKAAASVNSGDFKGLRKLRELVGPPFVTGIVLYDGTQALSFGEGLWAVPLDRL